MMQLLSTITAATFTAAALAVAGAPAGATPASQTAASAPPTEHHRYAQSEIVLGGAWIVEFGSPIRGNRHQVKFRTDNGVVSGFIRSYYCPTGATVTPRWASSRCTHRQTIRLENYAGPVGRVSPTTKSAIQSGDFMGRSGDRIWPFSADLTLYATEEPTDDGDGTFYSFWRAARPQGTFSGKSILAGSTRYGQIGGYGPV